MSNLVQNLYPKKAFDSFLNFHSEKDLKPEQLKHKNRNICHLSFKIGKK